MGAIGPNTRRRSTSLPGISTSWILSYQFPICLKKHSWGHWKSRIRPIAPKHCGKPESNLNGSLRSQRWQPMRSVVQLIENPMHWLERQLAGVRSGMLKLALEETARTAAYFGKESLYTSFGLERIGCHSLISKDNGNEVLYRNAKDCATAVH